jgi:thiamine-phosphate pyrophosphorylase
MTPGPLWWPRRGLYLVTPEREDTRSLVDDTASALRGGAVLVQYRDKSGDRRRRHEQALALKALCDEHLVPLLINDDIDLAARLRAAGVHLGEHDPSIEHARKVLGETAIIGISCYDDFERARDAAARGASYVAFGAFHASSNKPDARRANPSLLREARVLGRPCVAIGGITPQNAVPLIDAGADLIAVISAVYDAHDVQSAARRCSQLFEKSAP